MELNPIIVIKILSRLRNAPNGICNLCAKDFDIPFSVLGGQLEKMLKTGYISATTNSEVFSFIDAVKNEDTAIAAMITAKGDLILQNYITAQRGQK